MENVFIIIPARLNSNRLPKKALIEINGKILIQHVWEKLQCFPNVYVATDSSEIASEVKKFGGKVLLTKNSHVNGTERCNEAAQKLELLKDQIIINVQGDELYVNPNWIKKMYDELLKSSEEIITTITSNYIHSNDFEDNSIVKVSLNKDDFAISFERISKKSNYPTFIKWGKHIGIYGYKKSTLSKVCKLKMTSMEKSEKLEQLRWVENNFQIKCITTTKKAFSINTKEDIEILKKKNIL